MDYPGKLQLSTSDTSSESENELVARICVSAVVMIMAIAKRRRTRGHGGSRPGRRRNRDVGREQAGRQLDADYFARCENVDAPVFSEVEFERRFRMPRSVYGRVGRYAVNV
jgi:hypothetical protein